MIQNEIPRFITEVPDIGDLQSVPEFRKVADNVPRKNSSWPTVLLIGRDCMSALMQETSIMNREKTAAAVKTPL